MLIAEVYKALQRGLALVAYMSAQLFIESGGYSILYFSAAFRAPRFQKFLRIISVKQSVPL
jgi:hypothetical protein